MKPLSLLLALLAASVLLACGSVSGGPKPAALVSSVPFADGERLAYSLHADSGAVTGRGVLSVHRDPAGLRLEQRYEEASPPSGSEPTTDHSAVVVDPASLRPLSMERTVNGRTSTRTYAATYAADRRSVAVTEGAGKPRTIPLPEVVYDNESALWLWRTLALAEGYHQRYVSLDALGRARQTVDLVVVARQTVEVPAGTFEAWRLQIRSGRATHVAWVNVVAPHQVVQWDNGSVVFKLEAR